VPGRSIDVPLYWHHWRNGGELLAGLTEQLRRAAAGALVQRRLEAK
jgi:LysR family transcriptional regulator (chromosome initiation inhibitor)